MFLFFIYAFCRFRESSVSSCNHLFLPHWQYFRAECLLHHPIFFIPSSSLLGYVCLLIAQQFSLSSSSTFISFLVFQEPYSYKLSPHQQRFRSDKTKLAPRHCITARALFCHFKLTERPHWHSDSKNRGENQISYIKTP
jgi:hypothetical protein